LIGRPAHPATIARAGQAQAAAQGLHAAQPGYAGGLVIDDGQHFIAVNLWQTEHHAAAGRVAIGTQVQRLLEPLMATPSQYWAPPKWWQLTWQTTSDQATTHPARPEGTTSMPHTARARPSGSGLWRHRPDVSSVAAIKPSHAAINRRSASG